MNGEVFIAVISKCNPIDITDRTSFSTTINQIIPANLHDNERKDLEKGYTITKEDLSENPLFGIVIDHFKEKNYWSSWMEDWTSLTIYLLYTGKETFAL